MTGIIVLQPGMTSGVLYFEARNLGDPPVRVERNYKYAT